jgi:uncharacterized repeat protein (TIGR03803 family)
MNALGSPVLCTGAAIALLAGCGGRNTPFNPLPAAVTAERTDARHSYRVLHSFGYIGDGGRPRADLLNDKGTLYGTTVYGGSRGGGAVFAITTSGKETVLHSFAGNHHGGDGGSPFAGLISVDGTFYGTTSEGGAHDKGTVFAITPSGTETVLHSFRRLASGDGVRPMASLLNVNGTLYGTTARGGSYTACFQGCGTVFSITMSGKERVLYNFGRSGDGVNPEASLTNTNGTLYGTTESGGADGYGTVFAITTSGKETVLYSFKGGATDGQNPYAGLINVNGKLYGTTFYGGENCSSSGGCGTVFSITSSGKETVLYSFGGSGSGVNPEASLLNVNGVLYGTAYDGGARGSGAVFAITTSGTQKTLHSFGRSGDGANPEASLINVNGTLYGTTFYGGSCSCDGGTVFALKL